MFATAISLALAYFKSILSTPIPTLEIIFRFFALDKTFLFKGSRSAIIPSYDFIKLNISTSVNFLFFGFKS